GSSVIGVFAKSGPHIIGLHLLSFVGFMLSATFGLWLIWGILRHSASDAAGRVALSAGKARLQAAPRRGTIVSAGRDSLGRVRSGCHGSATKDIWRTSRGAASVGRMQGAVLVAELEPEAREYLGRQLRDDGFDVL